MKRVCGPVLVGGLLAAFFASPLQAQGPDVSGAWDVTIQSPQGTNQVLLTLKKDGSSLSGTMKGARGERPLETVTLNGNAIKFTMKVNMQGQDMVFVYDGAIEKQAMKGTADFGGFATGDWTAVRHVETAGAAAPAAPAAGATAPAAPAAATPPAAAPVAPAGSAAPATAAAPATSGPVDVSGTWQFTVQTDMGSGTPTFTLKQEGEKVSGTYKGQLGEAPVTGTVKGSDLKLAFKVSFNGSDVDVVYTGKVQAKDAMKGTAKLGELGEASWTAKKQ